MHIVIEVILWILLILVLWVLVIVRLIRKIHPFPIPQIITDFIDNPIRRKFWQNPDLIAERTGAKPGDIALEIGPGKGSYSIGVVNRIKPDGILYSIDIQQPVLDRLNLRLKKEGITNIVPKLDDAYNLSFKDDSFDVIFAVTCLPEIPDPIRALKEFKRVLKPEGVISFAELFLDPDYPLRSTERKWAEEAGLVVKEEFGSWFSYQLNFGYPRKE